MLQLAPCRDRNRAPRGLAHETVWLPSREHVVDGVLCCLGLRALHPRLRCSPPPAGVEERLR